MEIKQENKPLGVLIVDDMAINNYITKEMLLPYGIPIDVVESGFDAVDRIKNGKAYDIIFMDHMMPVMDGFEATKVIREMGYKGCIVILTANASNGEDLHYIEGGFNKFISKPIDPAELDAIVNEYVGPTDSAGATKQPRGSRELTEMEDCFILDAQDAISVLEGMYQTPHTLTDEELELYDTTVHGLKSALRNIGEDELSDCAHGLEKAAMAHDTATMDAQTPAFISDIKELINRIKNGE